MKVSFNISLRRSLSAIATAVCAVVLSTGTAFAQDSEGAGESESSLMVGFKTGFTLSEMRTDSGADFFRMEEGNTRKQLGANVLVFGRYDFTKWVGGELELGWSQNAFSTYTTNPGNTSDKSTYRIHNFQANALLNVRIPVLSVYEPRFYIGPSYDLNFFTSERRQGTDGAYQFERQNDATNALRPHDLGAIVGVSTQFDLSFANLLLDARYRHGFVEQKNGRVVLPTQDLTQYNSLRKSSFAVMVGLGFPIM